MPLLRHLGSSTSSLPYDSGRADRPVAAGVRVFPGVRSDVPIHNSNVGAASSSVVIGGSFGTPRKYLPYRLDLTARRAGAPDTLLKYVAPSPTRFGGRVDPWLIFLPPDALYSAAFPARNFRLLHEPPIKPYSVPDLAAVLVDGPVGIQLRLTTREMDKSDGLYPINVWVGTLTSDWIQFPNDCRPNRRAQQR
jgi:hypothetical protein